MPATFHGRLLVYLLSLTGLLVLTALSLLTAQLSFLYRLQADLHISLAAVRGGD